MRTKQKQHRHKCPACGTIWEHGHSCAGSMEAHACPRCGTEQWNKHHGRGKTTHARRTCAGPRHKARKLPGLKLEPLVVRPVKPGQDGDNLGSFLRWFLGF